MRGYSCDQEQAAMRAVASDQWTPQLRAHAQSCVNCRDVVRFSQLLQRLAAAPKPHLPPAGYVWWKSRMRQRRAAQRRVTRLIAITQAATVAVSITGLAVWIIRHWPEVGEKMKSSLSSFSSSLPSLASNALALVYLCLALLLLNLLLTIRAITMKAKGS